MAVYIHTRAEFNYIWWKMEQYWQLNALFLRNIFNASSIMTIVWENEPSVVHEE